VRAFDICLAVLPRNWAEVTKLGQGLFKVSSVHIEVRNRAWAFLWLTSILVVSCEGHFRLQVIAYGSYGDVLQEPL
jgi:hypothetical protein